MVGVGLVRVGGGFLALLAVPSFLLLDAPLNTMLAFAFGVTGSFVALVVAERVVPAAAVSPVLSGDTRALADFARGLKLSGRPVYVPDQGNVGEERLFLPASSNDKPVPILDRSTVVYGGTAATKIGVAVAPPGLALLAAHEEAAGETLSKPTLPEVEAFLSGLARSSDLASGIRLAADGEAIVLRFRRGAVDLPCFEDPGAPACESVGCALCQAVGCALARSVGRPVSVSGAEVAPPSVELRYKVEGA